MLWRFSLYGFLKNQRYFEPFIVLAFLEKGLSFFLIGVLVAFREIMVNLLEIPSGAVADVCGRRRSMILSFAAYMASFVVFGLAENIVLLFCAMALFAVGDAFRTGTHKAMIFSWLRAQGRESERTRVYGYTRSWSQFGSALSVVLAAVIVFTTESYSAIFFFAVIPYMVGIVNFLGYPRELDCERAGKPSLTKVARHLKDTLVLSLRKPPLRRLILESSGFEGVFKAAKDYLQPVLQAAAVVVTVHWAASSALNDMQRAALLIGPVYLVLHLLSGVASRNAHRVVSWRGSEDAAARWFWGVDLLLFGAVLASAAFDYHPVMIAGFVLLQILQNLWRPVLISRFDSHGSEEQGATVLSIESQAKSVATMILAPLLGLAVDFVSAHGLGGPFWPVGAVGFVFALIFFATSFRGKRLAGAASCPPSV